MKKFSLQGLENCLQNCERFINIVTPRLLVLACVLSIVDLLTLGNLANIPLVIWIWAIIQGLAVEATLPEMWRRSANSFSRTWTGFGKGITIGLIALVLSVVVFFALAIQFTQQSTGVSLLFSMKSLGVNEEVLSYIRAGSVVFLTSVLSILNRTKQQTPVNSLLNTTKQFTKPTKQAVNSKQNREITTELHVVERTEGKQWEIYSLLGENPDMRTGELAIAAGVSKGYASQMRTRWLAEQEEEKLSS